MDLATAATALSVVIGVLNLAAIVWKASELNTQVANLSARLARIEGHEETRSQQNTALLERIARLEVRAGLPHPLQASL